MLKRYSKVLTFILAFTIIFTSISFENIVYADTLPEILSVELESVTKTDGSTTLRYKIRGLNFQETTFVIGTYAIDSSMYTLEYGAYIVERNEYNSEWDIWDIPYGNKTINIKAVNTDTDGDSNNNTHIFPFTIEKVPYIKSISTRKVYIGDTLLIEGTGFDKDEVDAVYIAGDPYVVKYVQKDTETWDQITAKLEAGQDLDDTDGIPANGYEYIIKSDGNIYIPRVKDPQQADDLNNDVKIIKENKENQNIVARYKEGIKVVKKIDMIDVEKIVPNTGLISGGTEVKIFENIQAGEASNLKSDMRIYIDTTEDKNIFTDIKLIMDDQGKVIGISGITPESPTGVQGVFDIIITDKTGANEQRINNAFTYEEKENLLKMSQIEPIEGKPSEMVDISGNNIIHLNIPYLKDIKFMERNESGKLVETPDGNPVGRREGDRLVVEYSGKHKEDDIEVEIKREIKLIIGQISEIVVDNLDSSTSLDKIQAIIPNTNDYGLVDVTINTSTTVTEKDSGQIIDVREEETQLVDGFTILPSITIPVMDSIEPTKGDVDKKIYITIKGNNFLVVYGEPIEYPVVKVGTKTAEVIGVFDDDNNQVNGIGREIGTIIKAVIPDTTSTQPGPVNVKITNPDLGETVVYDIFEFEKPTRDSGKEPKITKIDPNIGPLAGGNVITIEGENFEYQEAIPDVIVSIDGQMAKVISASSSKIEVEVPKGIEIGEKPVQVITEDGAMDTIEVDDPNREGYTYVRVLSDPTVERIAPNFGGQGTVVYIFGRDKGIDNPNFFEPVKDKNVRIDEMIGTRVLLNGIDVNEIQEEYDSDGKLTGNIYYKNNGKITHDGNGNVYEKPSKVQVIDRNTLRLEIPKGYTAGLKDVTILNPDSSTTTIVDGFDYKIPPLNANVYIDSINPNIGSNLGGDYITITGGGFKDGAEVFFGGYKSDNVNVITDGKMIVKTPAYPLPNPDLENQKDVEVVIVNYDGSSASSPADSSSNDDPDTGYRYMAPRTQPDITSIEPNRGTTLGNEIVTITGKDFRQVTVDADGNPLEEKDYEYPSVYFGGKKAKILEYKHNKLIVETPFYGKEGLVDVTVKNPQLEFGSVTKNNYFEYRTSKPRITSVFPERAQKIGGDEITVKGEEILAGDFGGNSSDIKIQMIPENSEYEPNIDVLAIFGDEKDEDELSFGEAQNVLGDIIIDYNANRKNEPFVIDGTNDITDSLIIFYEEKNKDSKLASYDLQPEERHIFVFDWKARGEDIGEEAMIVELIDDTLISRRRVAPKAVVVNQNDDNPIKTVEIQTPPILVIGQKNLYIENQDRGWDKTSFEYVNPSSRPVIKEIIPRSEIKNSNNELLKYYVESTIEGGLYITIDGYDFRQDVEVFIDGTPAPIVSRNVLNEEDSEGRLRTRLVVTSPKGDADKLNKEFKIMIVNPDGGFVDASDTSKIIPESPDAEAKPYYFVYRIPESSPYIDSILPTVTSQYGGNEIRIVGYDFRTGATVVIGGKSCSIVSIDNDEIVVKTPTDLTPGLKDVQVINTDHGTVTKTSAISVISYPEITTVTTEGGDVVDRVSIEGGQKIVLSGRHFQSGASVYFGGERKQIGHSDSSNIKGLFRDDDYYSIEEAYSAKAVEFISENQLIVTVPEVFKEGEYTITVLNTDTGLSDSNAVLDYRVPIPTDPIGLKAEIVNDKYIRIYGYSSSNASYYEIYACTDEDDPNHDDFKYLDTTEKTSYKITKFKELDDDENIYLRIRAVNKYGPSEWSDIAKISYRDLDDIEGIGNEDTDGDLVSDYQETIGTDGVNVVIGNKDLRGSDYYIYVIDLKDKKYDKIDKRIINIPGKIIRDSNKTMLMDNGDTKIQFNVRNFYVYSFINLGSKEQEATYGRVVFNRAKGKDSDYMERKIPRKYKLISRIYDIKTEFQVEEKTIDLDSISGHMDLEISYDENRLMGLKESKLGLYKFDPTEGEWIPLAGGVNPDTNKVYARIDGPGQYAILGEK